MVPRFLNIMQRLFSILVLGGLAAGCVSFPAVYGEDWAEAVRLEDGECPDVDSVYRITGEYFSDESGTAQSVSLTGILGPLAEPPIEGGGTAAAIDRDAADGSTVRLKRQDSGLLVTLETAGGAADRFLVPVRPGCRDSALLLEPDWDGATATGIVSVVGRSTVALRRGTDGSLLVHQLARGAVMVTWWPVLYGTDKQWYRFAAANLDTPSAGTSTLNAAFRP